jgi:biopolymer transport protein ExbD
MKFKRHAKMTTAHLDMTPFAGMFFCLLVFVLLAEGFYRPGVRIELPVGRGQGSAMEGRVVSIALDKNGQYFYQNQMISESDLSAKLKEQSAAESGPTTLYVAADKAVTQEQMSRLRDIAVAAGISRISEGFLPGPFDDSPSGSRQKTP